MFILDVRSDASGMGFDCNVDGLLVNGFVSFTEPWSRIRYGDDRFTGHSAIITAGSIVCMNDGANDSFVGLMTTFIKESVRSFINHDGEEAIETIIGDPFVDERIKALIINQSEEILSERE